MGKNHFKMDRKGEREYLRCEKKIKKLESSKLSWKQEGKKMKQSGSVMPCKQGGEKKKIMQWHVLNNLSVDKFFFKINWLKLK